VDPSTILASLAKLSSGIIYALLACCLWMMVITGTGFGWDLKPVSFSNAFQYAIPAILGTWFLWLNYRRERAEISATTTATAGGSQVRSAALRLVVSTILAIGVVLAIVVSVAAYMRADFNAVRDALLKATADSPSGGSPTVDINNPSGPTNIDGVKTDEDIANSIISWAGGYVNDPNDLGGPTKYGITLNALTAWRGGPVTTEDMKALGLAEAKSYYLFRMAAAGYDSIVDLPLRAAIANIATHAGDKRANTIVQRVLRDKFGSTLPIDGEFGPGVIKEVNAVADPTELRAAIVCEYLSVLRRHPSFSTFQEGFLKRVKFLYPANRALDC
jgi:hypothetical protein